MLESELIFSRDIRVQAIWNIEADLFMLMKV